jgi:hypothetical protein
MGSLRDERRSGPLAPAATGIGSEYLQDPKQGFELNYVISSSSSELCPAQELSDTTDAILEGENGLISPNLAPDDASVRVAHPQGHTSGVDLRDIPAGPYVALHLLFENLEVVTPEFV